MSNLRGVVGLLGLEVDMMEILVQKIEEGWKLWKCLSESAAYFLL